MKMDMKMVANQERGIRRIEGNNKKRAQEKAKEEALKNSNEQKIHFKVENLKKKKNKKKKKSKGQDISGVRAQVDFVSGGVTAVKFFLINN